MRTEDYVSFGIAKLLKEKGFNEKCYVNYSSNGSTQHFNYQAPSDGVPCPTLQMALKWLREKYNLEIYPYHNFNSKWWFEIVKYPNSVAEYESGMDREFNTYEEACEAGIRYCLENLI